MKTTHPSCAGEATFQDVVRVFKYWWPRKTSAFATDALLTTAGRYVYTQRRKRIKR